VIAETMRTVAVVQARMGSSRFPGKVMCDLAGRPLIDWVLSRIVRSARVDDTVLATTSTTLDDPLARYATGLGVAVYRGDEYDVLHRVTSAASQAEADLVVRVCADNPFVDPVEIDRLVEFYRRCRVDYACNHQDRLGSGYPDGFGAEILSMSLLEKIDMRASNPRQREHVTLYLWQNPGRFRLTPVPAPPELAGPGLRFDVDVPADLVRLEALLIRSSLDVTASATQVVEAARGKAIVEEPRGLGGDCTGGN
jgi:spore coat polysaccharide biosynthesis protein SpsF